MKQPWTPPYRPPLSDHDHGVWRRLIHQRCGLDFGSSRTSYLSRCLWQRAQALGADSYDAYLRRLTAGPEEWESLVELLVNGESSFFRHPPSYNGLGQLLPEILRRKAGHGDFVLRLWSAGCSRGQEPYSMAACALEAVEQHTESGAGSWQVRVIGSDLSRRALDEASHGQYRSSLLRNLPPALRRRCLDPAMDDQEQPDPEPVYRVRAAVRAAVRFQHWNLVQPESWSIRGQDVIFCQNLLIYLRQDDRATALQHLCQRLSLGGYLFLAPGEVVGWRQPGIRATQLEECLVYQRQE